MAGENLNEMEERLRSMGQQADAGDIDPTDLPEGDGTASSPAAAEKEEPAEKPVQAEKPAPKEEEEPKQETPAEETPYQKARREKRDREAKAWQKIEEEKARVKAEREELEAERQRVAAAQAAPAEGQNQAKPQGPRDEHGYAADDYEKAAAGFEEDGDIELARSARKRAGELRQAEQAQRSQQMQQQFAAQWWQTVEQQMAAVPELRDANSAMGKAVQQVLQANRALSRDPEGFKHAVEIAQAKLAAGEVPVLRGELEKLKAENQRLIKLTSVTGTPPARGGSDEGRDLSERDLRRLAAQADGGGD